jgi:hypothetical protein
VLSSKKNHLNEMVLLVLKEKLFSFVSSAIYFSRAIVKGVLG